MTVKGKYSLNNPGAPEILDPKYLNKNLDLESGSKNKYIKPNVKSTEFRLKFWKKKNKNKTEGNADIDLTKDCKITEHLKEVPEVCSSLGTHITEGLSQQEAESRLARDGPNSFTPPKQTAWYVLYLHEMTGGIALLLWFASIASFVAYGVNNDVTNAYLGAILAITVLLTGTFSYYQQASSNSVFKSFKNMAPPQTTVIRDGKKKQIPADQIVVGDLVFCQFGDRIPADIRIIKCDGMKVDNSSLTGETDPLLRSPDVGHENPLEARNLAFFSTNCVDGSGFGIAVATGDHTVMGDIARLVTNIKNEKTPIAKEIDRFIKIITVIALVSGIIFFAIAMGFGSNFFDAFIFMIGITVGNVPEGLLPALTVSLTLSAKKMASKNCLVKHLEAVETLGSTSVICSDKTGTLTQNRMTVEHCWLGTDILKVSHNREEVKQQITPINKCWDAYKRCAILCSRSEFTDENPDIMKRLCSGDASETAILRFMESVEGPVIQYRSKFPKVAEKPFSSTYKYQFSIHHNPEGKSNSANGSLSNFFLVMKGAPERIIKLCTKAIGENGETIEIDSDFINNFEDTYRELGSMGERVLALCDHDFTQFPSDYKFDLDEGHDFDLADFRFLGLVAMIDPPRPTVPGAVGKCRSAGIKVVMVTGDHPITAQAIAGQVGIFTNSHRKSTRISLPTIDRVRKNTSSIVVPGDELTALTNQELQDILSGFGEIVFARTSPQQKLRIVENFQAIGQIVAVTGDGVNDSPALKRANIGIAMGITGSEVSKQAADMILLDDNFATIVVGVEEGRRIFDNLKKIIYYILTVNVTTLFPYIIYVIFGFPLPMGTIIVLLICLGVDMVPAVSLAYEKAESDIMSLPPRNPQKDRLVNSNLILTAYFLTGAIGTCAGFNGYFCCLFYEGFKPHQLWQLREQWDSPTGIVHRYGANDSWTGEPTQLTTFDERKTLLIKAQSAYFIAVVVTQWMNTICSKTRRLSIFSQGMDNWVLNGSIVFATALSVFFCYTPGLNTALQTAPVIGQVWVSSLWFFGYVFVFEEIRKLIIRRYPNSFLGKELLV